MAKPSGRFGDTRYAFAAGSMTLSIDTTQVARLFARFPEATAFELRDAFGRIAGRFRRHLLARHKGGSTSLLNLVKRAIFYRVAPRNVGRRGPRGQVVAAAAAARGALKIEDISMRIYATSKVPLVHEEGATITGTDMLVPIRSARNIINAVGVGSKTRTKLRLRRAAKVQIGKVRYQRIGEGESAKLLPMFAELDSVTIPARLGFYATWRETEPTAQRYLAQALDRAAKNSDRWLKAAAKV